MEAMEAEETVAPLEPSCPPDTKDSASPRQHRQKRKYSVSLKSHAEVADFLQQIHAGDSETGDGEHTAGGDMLHVTVPEGVAAGQVLYVGTPDGREIVVTVPEGVDGGQEIEVDVGESATTVEEYERILAEEEFAAEAASTAADTAD